MLAKQISTAAIVSAVIGAGALALPASAQQGDVLTLGAAVSLTGKYASSGQDTKDGYDITVKKINEAGGVAIGGKKYKLEVKYYDDESTPARAAQLAERLIQQDGIKYILGPYGSGLTKAMAPITEKYKVPMIEANGAARELFQNGWKYLFATLTTADQYVAPSVELVAEQAQKAGKDPSTVKIVMAFENDPFSLDVRTGIVEAAKKYKMQILVDDKLPPDINDMAATLTKVKALKPDLLIVSGHEKGAALVVRQTAEMKVDVPMIATSHCDTAQITEKQPKISDYVLCASQWDRSLKFSDKLFGSAEDFAKLFEKDYKRSPSYQVAESAAAVMVFADAFSRSKELTPEAVRDAIAATDIKTFYGPIKFDETGQNAGKKMIMFQVQNGQYKVVYPAEVANAQLIYPIPSWSKR
ncbi:MAG: amino acid transporter substrate-binding protein [Rhodospirillales bacterium]|nr:amino acid transporter substrate-binding protein [Rhodospirillales bacterium]